MSIKMRIPCLFAALACCVYSFTANAETPPASAALALKPVQKGVEIANPTADEIAQCTVQSIETPGMSGWIVVDGDGLTLRKFADTNGDNQIDQWCYYDNGVEVYRDIDSNANRKTDQYRWFATAGSRHGVDTDEDGVIDRWSAISPEETSAEVVQALAARNANRLAMVLLSRDELESLGLGKKKTAEIDDQLKQLAATLRQAVDSGAGLSPNTEWVQFNASMPGVVPAGTDGSTRDIAVYEDAIAIAEGDRAVQVHLGPMIQVGKTWKLIALPKVEATVASLHFFLPEQTEPQTPTNDGLQMLIDQLEKLDQAIATSENPTTRATMLGQRVDLIEKIAASTTNPADRKMWLLQAADMVTAATQQGDYPNGPKRLQALYETLSKNPADEDIAAYIRFRSMSAAYNQAMIATGPAGDFAAVQKKWLEDLQQFVTDYPQAEITPEVLLQLAIGLEFNAQEPEAIAAYNQLATRFPGTPQARKAAGSKTRLESVGKVIALSGPTLDGKQFDLSAYKGRIVIVQYWSTWCEPCKSAMPLLKELQQKYSDSLRVIGICLDQDESKVAAFLKENPLPWPQVYEPGGLDSPQADAMGILTLPTTLLIDQTGKVVSRNVPADQLETEIKKLIQ